MPDKVRNKRLRYLISRLNKERRKQDKKIDILCSDLVGAQKTFIGKLDTFVFAASFYESIIGKIELDELCCAAGRVIKEEVRDVNVALFIRQQNDFELYAIADNQTAEDIEPLENAFSRALVDNVCKNNQPCMLDEMLAMGLQLKPSVLSKISAAAIPLVRSGLSVGFILVYRWSGKAIEKEELKNILAVTSGLASAIVSCQAICY